MHGHLVVQCELIAFLDMVLEDVTELYVDLKCDTIYHRFKQFLTGGSDYSGNHTKLSKILLNGNNICMVRVASPVYGHTTHHLLQLIPGGEGPVAT